MPSKVGICNIAIGLLGAETIGTLTDGSSEALACSNHWDTSRDATLAAMDWTFARKRVELSQLATSPDFGWDYQYQLPPDCLVPLFINEGAEPKWIVEGNYLLTNEGEVELVYTFRVTDPGAYTALFTDALAVRLAADIAPAVTRKFELQQKLMQLFDYKIKSAQSHDANIGNVHKREDMDADNYSWVEGRE